jgi:transcriptional regulator with XRE-family HTH domain
MVGSNIKNYLIENGIKQSFVADKADLTVSQMSDICNDNRNIDVVTYWKICKALNQPLDKFLPSEVAE